ncbi:MAG: 50S ribosomal protein L25, partial [Terracoccus sp.]
VESQTVELEVLATAIPERITVSVEGLRAGTQILASQLELPEGAALVTDGDALVVNVTQQITAEAMEAELAEAESEAGIEHEATDAEEAEAADAAAESTDGDASAHTEASDQA